VATILNEETCAELIALMRINTEDLPAVFKTRTSLSQMFFIAIGMTSCSKEGRWALYTAWEDQVGEITKHCLRFQGVDPALQYVHHNPKWVDSTVLKLHRNGLF